MALGASGYFEAVSYLVEDRRRADEYTAESKRVAVLQKAKDFGDYLSELQMVISFAPFDAMGRSRISQLINKSNQFNLTTRRYTEAQVAELEADPSTQTLQVSLRDRFGDSGMIAVLIARRSGHQGEPALDIDTSLMSCRVLGRKVEEAMLRELALAARAASLRRIVGRYIPQGKKRQRALCEAWLRSLSDRDGRRGRRVGMAARCRGLSSVRIADDGRTPSNLSSRSTAHPMRLGAT